MGSATIAAKFRLESAPSLGSRASRQLEPLLPFDWLAERYVSTDK